MVAFSESVQHFFKPQVLALAVEIEIGNGRLAVPLFGDGRPHGGHQRRAGLSLGDFPAGRSESLADLPFIPDDDEVQRQEEEEAAERAVEEQREKVGAREATRPEERQRDHRKSAS